MQEASQRSPDSRSSAKAVSKILSWRGRRGRRHRAASDSLGARSYDGHLPEWRDPDRRPRIPAGRVGEARAIRLSEQPVRAGLRPGPPEDRHPCRPDGRTIDYAMLEAQPGDKPPAPFSFLTAQITTAPGSLPYHGDNPRDARDIRGEHPSRADVFRGRSRA